MDKRFKFYMLITSFIPLWVSILVIDAWSIFGGSYTSVKQFIGCKYVELLTVILILILLGTSLFALGRFFHRKIRKNEISGVGKILSAKRSNNLVSDFLLAYILPMIAFDFTSLQGVVLFMIYFCVMAFLSIRNNSVYTNILFEFGKYHVYDCELECEVLGKKVVRASCMVFSKSNLINKVKTEISYFDFNNDVYIDMSRPLKEVKS